MTKKKENAIMGRPRIYEDGAKRVNIYLSLDRAEKLKRLGGSKWVARKLDEEDECQHSQK